MIERAAATVLLATVAIWLALAVIVIVIGVHHARMENDDHGPNPREKEQTADD